MTDAARPLLTLAVCAFNQAPYIREAVESSLAQTYEPLEIILSDDCSVDLTFEIMREMTSEYDGPHKIVLNRNSTNLGICSNVNRVMELSRGELIVTAAGDDRALPNRVGKAFEVWNQTQRRADGLVFGFFSEGADGPVWRTPHPSMLTPKAIVDRGTAPIRGASAAWTRRLIQQWGPLPGDAWAEDQVLAFRAALSGGVVGDPTPVVVYRRNTDKRSLNENDRLAERLWRLRRVRRFYCTYMSDLGGLKELSVSRFDEVQDLELTLLRRKRVLEREIAYLEQGTRIAGLRYMLAILGGRTWIRRHWKDRPFAALTILRHLVVWQSRIVELAQADHHAPEDLVKLKANGSK